MLADPSAAAGSIAVDGDVIRASVAAAWRTLVAVVEVIAAHDAHEAIVMGEGEADTHGIFLRLSRHTDVKEIKILKKNRCLSFNYDFMPVFCVKTSFVTLFLRDFYFYL